MGFVHEPVGYAFGHLSLNLPRLMKHWSKGINVASTQFRICCLGQSDHRSCAVRFLARDAKLGGLLLQQTRGGPSEPCVEEQEARFEVRKDRGRAHDSLHLHGVVWVKADEIEAAISCGILILLPDGLS